MFSKSRSFVGKYDESCERLICLVNDVKCTKRSEHHGHCFGLSS